MQEVTSRRPAYVITRFGEDPPRLFEVTGRQCHGKALAWPRCDDRPAAECALG